MKHLSTGLLRRGLDEPHVLLGSQRRHLDDCSACRERRNALAAAACIVADAFSAAPREKPGSASYAGASERCEKPRGAVSNRVLRAETASRSVSGRPTFRAPFVAWGACAVAVLVILLAATPLRSVAANFLMIFEPRAIVALPFSQADAERLRALPNLTHYGTMQVIAKPRSATVHDVQAAAHLANMPLRLPAFVPRQTGTEASYTVFSRGTSAFTFSAARAREAAGGRPLPPMPPGLDGSRLVASVGPAILTEYETPQELARQTHLAPRLRHEHGWEGLVVAQVRAPVVYSTGVSTAQVIAYLSEQPGVSPQLRAELHAIGDPAETLPIPIPIDRMRAATVYVDGSRGFAVGDNTGVGSFVVWENRGIVYAVGGELPMQTVLAVANSFH